MRILIGLVLPFVAVDLMVPLLNASDLRIAGVPVILVWLSAWFVLTALCLAFCWRRYDRHMPEDGG